MTRQFFAVVPAAGIGSRMQADRPKQYLSIHGKTVFEHTLERLLCNERIAQIIVALAPDDDFGRKLSIVHHEKVTIVDGGKERVNSVLNGLKTLEGFAQKEDWVLVHDVARPCLEQKELNALMDTLEDDSVGGLLAVPVSDTIKRVNKNHDIETTVDRSQLWHALTPQMFRLGQLTLAIEQALENNVTVTDESSAIEAAGLCAKVVEGCRSNIKITRPEDLALAEFYLGN